MMTSPKFWMMAAGMAFMSSSLMAQSPLKTINSQRGTVEEIKFTPDGKRILAAEYDQGLVLYNFADGQEIYSIPGFNNAMTSCAINPSGTQMAGTGGDSLVRVFNTKTYTQMFTLPHDHWIYSVIYTNDGQNIVTGSTDEKIKIWDANTGNLVRTLVGHQQWIWSVTVDKAKKYVVSAASDNELFVWDFKSGTLLKKLIGHTSSVWSVDFSPKGKEVVSGSWDGTIKVWDVASGNLKRSYSADTWVYCVRYSPDGKYILAGDQSGNLYVYAANSDKLIRKFAAHDGTIEDIQFSKDKKTVVTCGDDSTIKIWDIKSIL